MGHRLDWTGQRHTLEFDEYVSNSTVFEVQAASLKGRTFLMINKNILDYGEILNFHGFNFLKFMRWLRNCRGAASSALYMQEVLIYNLCTILLFFRPMTSYH